MSKAFYSKTELDEIKGKAPTLKKMQYDYVHHVLRKLDFHMTAAAYVLEISIRTLRNYKEDMLKLGYVFVDSSGRPSKNEAKSKAEDFNYCVNVSVEERDHWYSKDFF